MKNKILKKIVAVIAAVAMVAGVIYVLPAEKAKAAPSEVYLVGALNNWNADDPIVMEQDGNIWTYTHNVEAAQDIEFKVLVGGKGWGNDKNAEAVKALVDVLNAGGNDKNMKVVCTQAGTVNFEVTFGDDGSIQKVKASGTAVKDLSEYYIVGDDKLCNPSWGDNDFAGARQLVEVSDGVWSCTIEDVAAGMRYYNLIQFKSWDYKKKDSSFELAKTSDVTFTYIEETGELEITSVPKELPDEYYLVGDEGLCGANWGGENFAGAKSLVETSTGVWTYTVKDVEVGKYNYNVIQLKSWDNILKNSSVEVEVKSDVIFTYTKETGNVEVTVVPVEMETETATEEKPTTEKETTTEKEITTEKETTTEEETTTKTETTTEEETTTKEETTTEEETTVSSSDAVHVAGDEAFTGKNWSTTDNAMKDNGDGTYTLTFENVNAGTYGFKVVNGDNWGDAYNLEGPANGMGDEARVTVEKDGSTVIIGFDGSKATLKVIEPATEEPSNDETTVRPAETTGSNESTTEEETTTKEEVTTEEETTKKAEPTTKEEMTTEEETTAKEEPTTEKTTEKETESVIKPSEITKEEGKNSAPETVKKEEIVEPEKVVDTAVEKMEKTDDKTVEVVSPKPQTLTKEIFDTIKSEGKNLTVGVTDADNKLQYSWTFSDKAINNTNMNIDLTITFDAPKKDEISKLTGNKEAAYISFAHHGELPGPATIKTYVGDKYKNGDTVYLYYFDEEANKVLMVGDKPLTVKGGYVEYTITHCSTYFLMGEKLAGVAKDVNSLDDANVNVAETETESKTNTDTGNTAKPGDNSNVVMWCALLCVMVGIVVFSRKKQLIEE